MNRLVHTVACISYFLLSGCFTVTEKNRITILGEWDHVYVIEDGEKFREPDTTLKIGFHRHGLFTWRYMWIGHEEVLTGKYEYVSSASGLRIRFRGAFSEQQNDRL